MYKAESTIFFMSACIIKKKKKLFYNELQILILINNNNVNLYRNVKCIYIYILNDKPLTSFLAHLIVDVLDPMY